jgi:class 3 adenylate cyclase
LRGDEWKVFWRTESGGVTRENIEAWCLDCFAGNFEAPRETVALLASDIAGYGRLIEEDRRRAVTMKSVLRDAAERAANAYGGRVVLDRLDDDVLLEFASSREAVEAARNLCSSFREIALRLDLAVPELCGAIHFGEVTRWRNGFLVGDAVELMARVRCIALEGRIVLTESAVTPLGGKVELEPVAEGEGAELPDVGGIWALLL